MARKVRRVRVGYYWVALHVWNGTIYAIEDECPHRGATLANGVVTDDGFVACPEHGWEFNLVTGFGRVDWEGCVVRFELEERDGDVFAAEKPPPRFPMPRAW